MDGLECKELFLSSLERTYRIDAEFYSKHQYDFLNCLNEISVEPITNYISVSDGNHMSVSDCFQKTGIPYYRGQDIHNVLIESSHCICIDEETFNKPYMKRSHLQKNDVLLSIVGTVGEISMVSTDNKATCNCKLAILRPNKKLSSELIFVYLKSKYGFYQIDKFKRGAVQMGFILEDMNQIKIPCFSESIDQIISNIFQEIRKLIKGSEDAYKDAEKLFEDLIEYKSFEEPNEVYSTKLISSSFLKSGRLDAEYYQLRYDMLFDILKKLNTRRLSEIVSIKKSIEPGSEYYGDVGVPFVRVSDLSKFEVSEPDIKIPKSLCVTDSSLFPEKDTILFSKDGSIGIAYKVEKYEEFVTSGALLHLKVKNTDEILPDYLTIVLNSKIVQMQAERDAGGSVIKHWKPDEIKNVVIPVLDIELQKQISKQAQHCFKMRKAAKELLNKAILIVETAIENGEEEAMKLF